MATETLRVLVAGKVHRAGVTLLAAEAVILLSIWSKP